MHRDEPGLMLGYWNRPDEEKEALRGEWFVSGDLVEIDAEGYVWLHGRADEVMNAGGYRVSPAEVERCLIAHPGIAEAAVAERPGRDAGTTIIKAYVVARSGEALDEADILAHCARHLAGYKCPRAVQVVGGLAAQRQWQARPSLLALKPLGRPSALSHPDRHDLRRQLNVLAEMVGVIGRAGDEPQEEKQSQAQTSEQVHPSRRQQVFVRDMDDPLAGITGKSISLCRAKSSRHSSTFGSSMKPKRNSTPMTQPRSGSRSKTVT